MTANTDPETLPMRFRILLFVAALPLVAGCSPAPSSEPTSEPAPATATETPAAPEASGDSGEISTLDFESGEVPAKATSSEEPTSPEAPTSDDTEAPE